MFRSRFTFKDYVALFSIPFMFSVFDILLAEAPGGVNFALQYLWMLEWVNKTYDFQYFLRLDDDYFVCFEKLMLELEVVRPRERFQWGWLHCDSGKGRNKNEKAAKVLLST